MEKRWKFRVTTPHGVNVRSIASEGATATKLAPVLYDHEIVVVGEPIIKGNLVWWKVEGAGYVCESKGTERFANVTPVMAQFTQHQMEELLALFEAAVKILKG